MITFPNAKINIGLQVTEKRNDGYHNLQSVFYPIMFCDGLEIISSKTVENKFTFYGKTIDGNITDNLIFKALNLISKKKTGYHIFLKKVIPMGGGLGGGSANAAFTLKMINEIENLNLPESELFNLAMQLGSDCGFFIKNQPSFVQGRGELVSQIDLNLKGKWLLLVLPNFSVSTKMAFSKIVPKKPKFNLNQLPTTPINQWRNLVFNDFEQAVFENYPDLANIKNTLYKAGALFAQMSGTGSTIFGIFNEKAEVNLGFETKWLPL